MNVQAFLACYGSTHPKTKLRGLDAIDERFEQLCPASLSTRYQQDTLAAIDDELLEILECDYGVLQAAYMEAQNLPACDLGMHMEQRLAEAVAEHYGDDLIQQAWTLAREQYKEAA